MSQLGKSDEQSMEEILASIRSSVDTPESAPAPPTASSKVPKDAGPSSAPVPAASNGSGRLQDALLQAAPGAQSQATHVNTPPGGLSAASNPSPSPTAVFSTPAPSSLDPPPRMGQPAASAPAIRDDDLSDLFADPAPASTSSSVGQASPSETAKKISAATFGTMPTPSDVPNPASGGAPPLSPLDSLENTNTSIPDTTASESVAPPEPSSQAAPLQTDIEPKPKREPSFEALKTLASGTASEQAAATSTTEASIEPAAPPSVMVPEMRDIPKGTNPVAEMQSMAAASSPEKSSEVRADNAPVGMSEDATMTDELAEAPTEIIAASPAVALAKSQSSEADVPMAASTSSADGEPAPASRSLEDVVVELLKPQLAQWLEANMPRIVERALREEQAKASDKTGS